MLTDKQAETLSSKRGTHASSRAMQDEDLAIRYAQFGVPLIANHAAYVTVWLAEGASFDRSTLASIAKALDEEAARHDTAAGVIGVGFGRWRSLAEADDSLSVPKGMVDVDVLQTSPPYAETGGDLFFHLKGPDMATCEALATFVEALSELAGARFDRTLGNSRHGGKQYGGKILNGIINAVDPVGLSTRALIGNEDAAHKGGCFLVTQRFVHDWEQLGRLSVTGLEDLIGRDTEGNIIPDDDDRRHIKTVRVLDENNVNHRVLGQNLAYGSAGHGREGGVFAANYAKSAQAIDAIMKSMLGDKPGFNRSRHLDFSHADGGSVWYIPSTKLLGLPHPHPSTTIQMNAFFAHQSENRRMFYNARDYLHRQGHKQVLPEDQLSDRLIELIGLSFSRWHDTWYRPRKEGKLGSLYDSIEDEAQREALKKESVAIRKGWAHKRTLELMASPAGRDYDAYRIHPRELIVGVLPDYTLGSGVDVMTYLVGDEIDASFATGINEFGAAGHNVPYHERALKLGVGGMLDYVKGYADKATTQAQKDFYASVVLALEGVQGWLKGYAALARSQREACSPEQVADIQNLDAIIERLDRLQTEAPESFHDAAQLVYTMHCCLHHVGECVSIGRLDQMLAPFLGEGPLSAADRAAAQEIIDCFWIKMDEKVLFNRRYMPDRLTYGSGAITYHGGDFPQGAAINQWVQQVTIGGLVADEGPERDACNVVTEMCLEASRKLPLNAPCLSLRVTEDTPAAVLEKAAGAILSGGAHPILLKDKALVPALKAAGAASNITTAHSRMVVCDGCYEVLVAGHSEFAFSYVPVSGAIEMALNQGRTYREAGSVHLQGLKVSIPTKPAAEIESFEELYAIYLRHYELQLRGFYAMMLGNYGNLADYCPSPLLSVLLEGCVETGRDLSQGGARYKILAPLMNGIAVAIDSLYCINKLVFDADTAVTSLPELRLALISNWGRDMKEPFFNAFEADTRRQLRSERYDWLRQRSLDLPRFGQGDAEVDAFAHRLVKDLLDLADEAFASEGVQAQLAELKNKYDAPGYPFAFVITPGIATFEDYAGLGIGLAASADGRLADDPVASDFSAMISPMDMPPDPRPRNIYTGLRSWVDESINLGLANGSPTDLNIAEDFPAAVLEDVIRKYGRGELGPNMLTISCADISTMEAAQKRPEVYDLVRMRMGGWSEFFVTMYPHHQEHHKRRPYFVPPVLGTADGGMKASDFDLTQIKGVGPAMEGALNRAGVYTIEQLANLREAELDAIDADMDIPFKKDSTELRAWVAEAQSLVAGGSEDAAAASGPAAASGAVETSTKASVEATTDPASAPTPLVSQGQAVDWWFAFKFNADRYPGKAKTAAEREGIFGGTLEDYDDQASDAKKFSQAYCFASSDKPTLALGEGAVGTTLSDPVGATFGQVYDGSWFYALWNDQFYDNPMKSEGAPHGHSKGMLAWNEAGEGVVMQVSTPSWPASGSREHPRQNDGNTLGYIDDDDIEVSQHFFALRLTKDDLVAVLSGLLNARVVCDPSKPELVRNGGPKEVMDLVSQLGSKPENPSVTKVKLSSGLQLISKPSTVEVAPWQLVSAELGGVDLRVATWWMHPEINSTKGGSAPGCWDSSLGTPGAVDIATTGTWEGQAIGLEGGNSSKGNHAKIGVSTSADTQLSIFGDMNQQGALCEDCTDPPRKCSSSQNGRGGLFFVLDHGEFHASLTAMLAGESGPLADTIS